MTYNVMMGTLNPTHSLTHHYDCHYYHYVYNCDYDYLYHYHYHL